jgi:hypothetical protein
MGSNLQSSLIGDFPLNCIRLKIREIFIMVVSLGKSSFKLDEDLVSIALESVIGGFCGKLKVSYLRDMIFSFCVANKSVGFQIFQLKKQW